MGPIEVQDSALSHQENRRHRSEFNIQATNFLHNFLKFSHPEIASILGRRQAVAANIMRSYYSDENYDSQPHDFRWIEDDFIRSALRRGAVTQEEIDSLNIEEGKGFNPYDLGPEYQAMDTILPDLITGLGFLYSGQDSSYQLDRYRNTATNVLNNPDGVDPVAIRNAIFLKDFFDYMDLRGL